MTLRLLICLFLGLSWSLFAQSLVKYRVDAPIDSICPIGVDRHTVQHAVALTTKNKKACNASKYHFDVDVTRIQENNSVVDQVPVKRVKSPDSLSHKRERDNSKAYDAFGSKYGESIFVSFVSLLVEIFVIKYK